jgi:hypothetical protein
MNDSDILSLRNDIEELRRDFSEVKEAVEFIKQSSESMKEMARLNNAYYAKIERLVAVMVDAAAMYQAADLCQRAAASKKPPSV